MNLILACTVASIIWVPFTIALLPRNVLRSFSKAPGGHIFRSSDHSTAIHDEEKIFRSFPNRHLHLPILSDCDNYYSGQLGDIFWHQNADNVMIHIPIDNSIRQQNIRVKLDPFYGIVEVNDDCTAKFRCFDKIIPSGSFWTLESDNNSNRFLQLELEKRFN